MASSYSKWMKKIEEENRMIRKERFEGLGYEETNKYGQLTKRVSDDESKIVVNISRNQIFLTRYGYGLKVGHDKVVWLKGWQAFTVADWYATEMTAHSYQVVLSKENYIVKQSTREFDDIEVGDCASDSDFEKANGYHSWEDMVDLAKRQEAVIDSCPIYFRK